jgi:transaldolase
VDPEYQSPGLNPLRKLASLGQSVWYDYIRRDLYRGSALKRLIEEDGLKGMTSNPAIFGKAIAGTSLYDDEIRHLAARGFDPARILGSLTVTDVRGAADVFRPVYEASGGDDGFVSIEVGPELARDTEGSIAEARRLWSACGRPNVMVKIPATSEGIAAIYRCLLEGININVTLLFSVSRYLEVMHAYLAAMEDRVARRLPVDHIRSVASFFVSRVDSKIDRRLDAIARSVACADRERRIAMELRGKAAIGNARIAYEVFECTFDSPRFERLRRRGVRLQRPLWASTSVKDPSYPPLYYVEALVGPDTVDTMPPETFDAYRESGNPMIRIHDDLHGARSVFRRLGELGIEESQVSRELEEEGARKFSASIAGMLKAIEAKVAKVENVEEEVTNAIPGLVERAGTRASGATHRPLPR